MNIRVATMLAVMACLGTTAAAISAQEGPASNQDIQLSPALADLLRAEMREIAAGVQGIGVALAAADWESIRATSARIRASYIMEKSLSPAQADELEKALPAGFRELDAGFHQRAEKLGAAAAAHDSELVGHHYSRLLESCVQCHSVYARKRFPGFHSPPQAQHAHGH